MNNGAADLADCLSFNVAPSASYVTDKRSVTFFPSGSNDYGPTGVRVIKIGLNRDQWLDPRSIKLLYDITNTTSLQSNPRFTAPSIYKQARTSKRGGMDAFLADAC